MLTFKNRNVAAIGEAMIELAPQASGDYRRGFAGDTFNTLWHMAQLMKGEGQARFVTRIGQDSISEAFAADLIASGINTAGVARDAARTMGLYLIELKNAERSFHYWRGQSAAKLLAADADFLAASLEDCGLIHLSGITLAILSEDDRRKLFEVLSVCRKKGALVSFDPNIRPRLWPSAEEIRSTLSRMLPLTDIALPSFDDEKVHWGDARPQDTIRRMASCGVRETVVKDGAGPVYFADGTHAGSKTTPPVSRLVDTTGAGDAFNAGYLVARLNGMTLDEAVSHGQRLAALVIGHYGARAPAEAVRAL